MAKLYVVGTPIGNLSDASPRVKETLAAASVVYCEDTRVTKKLLSAFDIHTPLARADGHAIASRVDEMLARVEAGEDVAFCSDAGMPAISDPGSVFVDAALDAGVEVEVVPGPSAVTCAVAASGFGCAHFFFEGFLPRKAGAKRARLERLSAVPGALVFYESPHRVEDTLEAVAATMPSRRVALVREITKVHESCVRAAAPDLLGMVREAGEVKGECVIVVDEPGEDEAGPAAAEDPREVASAELASGAKASVAAKAVAKRCGISRDEAYALVLELREG
jgi:16S rRNA (cytidine1402-2'-O)-methyltransferase